MSKNFGMTEALKNFSLEIYPSEIHAVVGENGAGKSTMIKIMTGVYLASAGEMLLHGEQVHFHGTGDAQARGIAAIYQEPMVFPDLNVAENIFLSHQGRGPFVNWRRTYSDARDIIARLGMTLDEDRSANGLTLAEQQTVEIARALSLDVKVLIMDEPTSSLSAHEVEKLMAIVRTLRAEGVAIIFISHRLEEVFQVADRVTVLRDGRLISTRPIGEVSADSLISEMVGRDASEFFARSEGKKRDKVALDVRDLTLKGVFSSVSFQVNEGEVLCFAGLVGARRTDVALSVFGVRPATSGEIIVGSEKVRIRSPQDAMKRGIAYVSEDRRKLGLAMTMPIVANATLATLKKYMSKIGILNRRGEIEMALRHRKRLNIRTPDIDRDVGDLSGGNQQKVMLAKWLDAEPRILIFDEPTRGIDVGAKAEVHNIIHDLAKSGVAVIVISSDLPEVLALADRIVVMREGRQMGIFDGETATQESIIRLATGQSADEVPA